MHAGSLYVVPAREVHMTMVTHPPKQLVRDFMRERAKERAPPPAPQDIRHQLGWQLIPQFKRRG
jgi:hypothetical protein